ncbi:MerR family DNA-binding protein [Pandoraea horticolens]|uniref:MerR family DNA-binding protein n=1 Tax=Pandoraea horticolens TaxID=2508298 RepID=UPI003CCD0914
MQRRQYDASVLPALALIALGGAAGFSLDDIAGMLLQQGKANINRVRLTAKADDLDRTIRQLSALRDELRHAMVCPAPEHRRGRSFSASCGLRVRKGEGERGKGGQ